MLKLQITHTMTKNNGIRQQSLFQIEKLNDIDTDGRGYLPKMITYGKVITLEIEEMIY